MEIFRCDFALQKILIPMPFARNEAFKKYYNAFKIKLIKIIKINNKNNKKKKILTKNVKFW